MTTQVKICGLTREEDVREAVEAGADAIGFDFREGSPRRVEASFARAAAAAVGDSIETIGVFADQDPKWVEETIVGAGLRLAQLGGEEEAEVGRDLGVDWYKVLRLGRDSEPAAVYEQVLLYGRDVFMLDARRETVVTGPARLDWNLATKVSMRASLSAGPRLVLAGGLHPDNVAEAVRGVRPWRVDVCSGVEASTGRKDPSRLRDFVAAVRSIG